VRSIKQVVCVALALFSGISAVGAAAASAAFPGTNGVITYHTPGDPDSDFGQLELLDPAGGELPPWMALWRGSEAADRFSPDLRRVARTFAGPRGRSIAVAIAPLTFWDAITFPRRRGEFLDDEPEWSPDGASIVFSRDDLRANGMIYTIGVDGSNLRHLRRGESPVWSTQGRIAFTRYSRRLRRQRIYTMDTSGRGMKRITNGRWDEAPEWSPDGRQLAFNRGGDIYIVAAHGGSPHQLTHARRWEYDLAFSPDGTQITFFTDRKLIIMPLGGSESRAVRCSRCWSPDWLPAPPAPPAPG
jgi:hypothetical protein